MQIPEAVIYGTIGTAVLTAFGYLFTELQNQRKKYAELELRMKDMEYNYKDRFTKLENLFRTEAKDIRHSQDNNMQRVLGAVEKISDSLHTLTGNFKDFFDKNPDLKKP